MIGERAANRKNASELAITSEERIAGRGGDQRALRRVRAGMTFRLRLQLTQP